MSTEKEKLEQTHSVDVGVGYQQDGGLSNQMTGATVGGLHRRLDNRQIQLVAAGGSIGTALFISIGGGLARGGPASLFLAYLLYSCVLALVNNSVAEMSTHMPVAGGFVRLAGEWVDDAWGFMAGWNFFLYEALCIPFEITALTFVISFWDDRVTNPGPTAAICAICIVLYAALNILAVSYYGEAEFWLSGGKLILIFLLFAFTFVTMCGGNPKHDAYGFRYWSNPGAFAEYRSTGDLGRFEGFLAALWSAGFTVVGPEYISMVAAESKHPSIYIKSAFKTVYFRFCLFFVVGALAVSVVIPYNDLALYDIYFGSGAGSGSAAGSPYVIAMRNLNIKVFPSIVNALIMTSIFSAGNTYTYVATRTLYSMSLEGRAPKFLNYTNRKGVPVYCFCVVMIFPFLSFLQVGSGSAVVLNWFVSIITGGGLINYIVMGVTFICYYKATVAQGFDRKKLPYYGWFQPYGAYIALAVQSFVVLGYGYSAFGPWNVSSFFQSYTMQIIAPITFLGWKFIKGTKFKRSKDVDLVWERPGIDLYESTTTAPITGFWEEMGHLVGIRKRKQSGEA